MDFFLKNPKKLALLAAVAALFLPVFIKATSAAEPQCQFQDSLAAFQDIQKKPVSDSAEGLRDQLNGRKDLLSKILDCQAKEASELKISVAQLRIQDLDMKELQSRLVSSLGETIIYYQGKKTSIKDLGVKGTKDLARQIRSWRSSTYAAVAQQVINLTLWQRNQELIQTALTRRDQMQHAITSLQLNENDDVKNTFEKTVINLREAQGANDEAKNIILTNGSTEDALRFIKLSLDRLSKTYDEFFTISEAVDHIFSH